jgi:hypothetical protein
MKKYTFDARYRKSVDNVLTSMGLNLISTPRQIENGTLMYHDPYTKTIYALYESGYIRRLVPSFAWGSSQTIGNKTYAGYQLNKTRREIVQREYNGRIYEFEQKVRIMANPMEQLGIVTAAIANYRNK